MKPEHTTENDEAVASFHDDPMQVVRVIAGLAAQHESMSEAERRGEPSPVRPDSPIVLAAKRICVLRGYAEDGNELPGFMERAARRKLAEQEAETRVKDWIERSRKGDTIYQVMESMKKENEELRAELARLS